MKFFRALYDSRHFEFEAYGSTEAAALLAMRNTLDAHAAQYGVANNWYEPEDISVYPIEIGKGLRDKSPIG
jgi:hypothetical protein